MTDKPEWLDQCTEISPAVDFDFLLYPSITHNYAQSKKAQVHTSMDRDHPVHDLPIVGDPPLTGHVSSSLALERRERLLDYYKQLATLAAQDEQTPDYTGIYFSISLSIFDDVKLALLEIPYTGGHAGNKEFLQLLASDENGGIVSEREESLELDIYADADWLYIRQSNGFAQDDATHHKINRPAFRESIKAPIERIDSVIAYLSENFGTDFWSEWPGDKPWPSETR